MRRTTGWIGLVARVLLLVLTVLNYQREIGRQHAEQQRRDAEWLKVNQDAARRFPPVLPGAKPDPAPLQGVPLTAGLAIAGSVALIGGAVLLISNRRRSL